MAYSKKDGKSGDAKEAEQQYRRLERMKTKRYMWDSHCQEVSDYVIPNKNQVTRTSTPGEKKNLQIFDSTAILANELLGGSLHGMLTNPSTEWFEFTTGVPELDDQDDVRKWLQKATTITHEVFNGSNFQTEIHELYIDQGAFGIGYISMEEDDIDVIRFLSRPFREIWIDENNKGQVDTVFRLYKWMPRQIIQEWGDACPEFIFRKEKEKPDEEIEILHVVEPNMDYSKAKKLSPNGKKFRSCYYIRNGEIEATKLSEGGFDTFPYLTPRWTKGTGEIYGRSPAMNCLCDIKMVNEMMRVFIKAQQKNLDPPMLVPDDGVIGSLRLTPGGVTYTRPGMKDEIKPLNSNFNIQADFKMIEDTRRRIKDAFYLDQLQLQEGPQKTATEVNQITEEKLRFLGPILGRQHSEVLRPLVERGFDIIYRRKMYPPVPKSLQGRKIVAKYRSTLAKAQIVQEANNMARALAAAQPFFQLDQKSVDNVDCDKGVVSVFKKMGLPQEMIRDKDQLKMLRDARDQANQAMLKQQQDQAAADQAAKITPAVKLAADAQKGAQQMPAPATKAG